MKCHFFILLLFFYTFNTVVASDTIPFCKQKHYEIKLPEYKELKPKIALALSGGGARAFAQIGVLEKLQESKIDYDYIIGTSMGAVIGGLVASGYTPFEIDSIVNNTKWDEIFAISDLVDRNEYFLDQKMINDRSLIAMRFKNFRFVMPEAFSFGAKVNMYLQNILTNGIYHDFTDFNNLKYPFRAVATDVIKGDTVSLKSGNIVTAVRASSTIPLRFTPIRIDSLVLVDGGLMANIPTREALEFKPDIIIAINSTSPLLPSEDLDKPWNLADQIVTTMMLNFLTVQKSKADYMVAPNIGQHLNTDFTGIDNLIQKGREAYADIGDSLKYRCFHYSDSLFKANYLNTLKHENSKYSVSCHGFEYYDSLSLCNYVNAFLKNGTTEIVNPFIDLLTRDNTPKITIYTDTDSNLTNILISAEDNHKIRSIDLKLSGPVSKDSLETFIRQKYNNLNFSDNQKIKINEDILRYLRDKGFPLSFISHSEYISESQSFQASIDLGMITNIKFVGNDYTKAWLIRRELTFAKEDYINAQQVSQSWENIVNTGLFSDVEILMCKNSVSGIDIIVKVKEYANQTASLGLRFDNEKKLQGGLDLIYDNLFNFGTRFFSRSIVSDKKLLFQLGLEQPRFINSLLTFQVQTYYKKEINNIFEIKESSDQSTFKYINTGEHYSEGYGFIGSAGTQVEKNGRISFDFRFEKERDFEKFTEKSKFKTLNTLRFVSIFDSENKRDFPTSGKVIQLSLETSLIPMGTDNDNISFSKALFNYTAHYSSSIHTFTNSFTFGFADATLPYPEFFKLGGEDSFLGMRENEKMGRQIVHGHLDYRFKSPQSIIFDTYFTFAYDIGAVWQGPEQIKFKDLTHGIGAILSLDTPVGPARLSIGKCFIFKDNTSFISWGAVVGYFSIGMRF
jgi:NTE family protein